MTTELKIAERPKPVVPEKVLFIMPADEELFIAALSTIQAYQKEMGNRQLVQNYFIHSENEGLNFLLDVIGEHIKLPASELVNHRRFDLVFKFDQESAYKISQATDKHATTAFGIQLGVEPSSLADLSLLPWHEQTHDVLLCKNLPHKLQEEIREILLVKIPDSKILTGLPDTVKPSYRILDCIGRCKVIIGVRSLETYAAACCERKGVIEIYPPGIHRRWLSKWTCQKYQMIGGSVEAVTADLVWKGLEALWTVPTYQATAGLTQTAQ